ncbi:MAG: extracellular solute-binding protein [Armatimonadetes bacterium]|nr:extracellular solute-binding protein [Armatimonadota bacterium]
MREALKSRWSGVMFLLVAALVIPVVLLALSGCPPDKRLLEPPSPEAAEGPTEPPPTPGTDVGEAAAIVQATGPATLELWTIWNTEPRKSALEHIVHRFHEQYPDIKVNITAVEPDSYKTRIRVAVGSGKPPDIFFVWSGEWLHNFVRGGNVLPITEALNANRNAWRNLIPGDGLRYYTFDGETYGIPFLRQCTFFFYNKDIFAQNGLHPPATWDDLLTVCAKLQLKGVIPIALGNSVKWPAHHYVSCLWQRLVGQDQLDVDFDPMGPGEYADPGYIKGLKMFKDLVDRGVFNRGANATDRETARALFYSGRAAMFYTGTWNLNNFRQGGEAPQEFWNAWDWFNFPMVRGGKGIQDALTGGADGYVISSRVENPAAAIAFLHHLGSVESARYFATECKELVLVKGAVDKENADAHLLKYAQQVEQAERISPWADTLMARVVAEALLDGCQALIDGKTTPEKIMSDIRERQAAFKANLEAAGGSIVNTEGAGD